MDSTINKALEISALGIAGVFVFMAAFYLIIMWMDIYLKDDNDKEGNS